MVVVLLLVACNPVNLQPADTILHGGNIVTLDSALPVAEAVAVRGGRIVAVGSDAEVFFQQPESCKSN